MASNISTLLQIQQSLSQLSDAKPSFSITLPVVAAIGAQGSGKTSVIESLTGKDLLPRGRRTRRPIVINLVRTGGGEEEFGEFEHCPGRRFFDFAEIKREIVFETERETEGYNYISQKPIHLTISSPAVHDITLVDLPGVAKVPAGDQPSDIESKTRDVIFSYIKKLNCVILAVSPANDDLANSDALQLARLVDPDGSRTIGVITKLDIMDRGTDARNFLLGKIIPLKLGYFGVVNRSQEDLKFNRNMKEALAFEQSFFSTIQAYNDLSHCCGIPQLANKLNQILVQHIKAMLPGFKAYINAQLISAAKIHASFGDTEESKDGFAVKLLNILATYCEAFCSMVEGKNRVSTDELSGGARIHYIFQSIFVKRLEEVDPCSDITDQDIRIAIQNAAGPKCALFLPEAPFEILVRKQIRHLLDPSLQCARFIYEELVKIGNRCLTEELLKYPILKRRMDEVIGNFLRDRLNPAERMITHIIDMQIDYINTSHPSFIGGNRAVEFAKQKLKPSIISTPLPISKDASNNSEKIQQGTDKTIKPRNIFSRGGASNGNEIDQVFKFISKLIRLKPGFVFHSLAATFDKTGHRLQGESERSTTHGTASGGHLSEKDHIMQKSYLSLDGLNTSISIFQLKEPPVVLKPSEKKTEKETEEIEVMKLLLKSYYDIVRKSIEDAIPKAIMHFLVNHTKRELHNVLIRKLYRENLLEEMLREPDDISLKKKRARDTLHILEQAQRALEELDLEPDTQSEKEQKHRSSEKDSTGLPRSKARQNSTFYSPNGTDFVSSLKSSPSKSGGSKSRKSSSSD